MNEQKSVKIISHAGFKYSGKKIHEDDNFITIEDIKEGIIKIPVSSISFIKEGEE